MSKTPYVRFFATDWRSGCRGLTLDQEGLYIRICSFHWEAGILVPLDDKHAARMLATNVKNYRRVRDELIELKKITKYEDGFGNDRAVAEYEIATDAVKTSGVGTARNVPAEQEHGRIEASKRRVCKKSTGGKLTVNNGSNPNIPPIHSEYTPDTSVVRGEINQQNQYPSIELELEPERTPLPPKGEPPKSGSIFWQQQLNPDALSGISVVDGELMLVNGTRQFWLSEFDDDEKSLRLALIEIAASLNSNSRTPIASQVNRKLSQICQTKLSRRNNYAAVVAKNAAKPRKLSRFNA